MYICFKSIYIFEKQCFVSTLNVWYACRLVCIHVRACTVHLDALCTHSLFFYGSFHSSYKYSVGLAGHTVSCGGREDVTICQEAIGSGNSYVIARKEGEVTLELVGGKVCPWYNSIILFFYCLCSTCYSKYCTAVCTYFFMYVSTYVCPFLFAWKMYLCCRFNHILSCTLYNVHNYMVRRCSLFIACTMYTRYSVFVDVMRVYMSMVFTYRYVYMCINVYLITVCYIVLYCTCRSSTLHKMVINVTIMLRSIARLQYTLSMIPEMTT